MLKLLVTEGAIGERLSASLLAWRHSGFSVHNGVRCTTDPICTRRWAISARHSLNGRERLLNQLSEKPGAAQYVP